MTHRLILLATFTLTLPGCGGPADSDRDNQPAAATSSQLAENPKPAPQEEPADRAPRGTAFSPTPFSRRACPARAARNWTGVDGKLAATGELVDVIEGKACLQKPDGSGAAIPLEQFCEADRRYVRSQFPATAESDTDKPDATADATPPPPPAKDETPPSNVPPLLPGEKVVIPFDFVSKFDDGRYGEMVGEMIWKKLDRQGEFVIPETMLDVRDTCESNNLQLTPDTPLPEVRKVLDETFAGHVAIWGSVERAPGHELEVYDLVIKCVDFSAAAEPKVVYQRSARTKSVSEIPHLYVKEMLEALVGRKPPGPLAARDTVPPPLDPLAEENWRQKPSLIAGTFKQGTGGVPQDWAPDWEAGEVHQREALGRTIQWIAEPGNSDNRVIRFTFDKATGDTTGVAYYSKFFPVEEGALYRFQCRWRSDGPKVKVFIKCYDEVGTAYRGKDARSPRARGDYQPELGQIREVYRSQQNLKGYEDSWNVQTEDFTPKHTKYTPRWGRVMLYAYLGGGVVEFDDVVVKQILPPYHTGRKVRRHSMESDVTVQEMEENERRSQQEKERRKKERSDKK